MTEAAVPDTAESAPAAPPAASPERPSNLVGLSILAVWLASGAALFFLGRPPHILTFAFVMVGWTLAVMAHEFSHAFVAWRGGDHTVKDKGYLDFDPRRYGNLQTSLAVPLLALALGGIGFPGGAVYLRDDLMRSRAWRAGASLAGPAATAVILLALAGVLRLWGGSGDLPAALSLLALFQAMALILNLLPLPGFDGFNAIRPFLPTALAPAIRRFQVFAPLALLGLIFFTPAGAVVFIASVGLSIALGLNPDTLQHGWDAFHFWR